MEKIKLIECPRDAMQGWQKMINTQDKIAYINSLIKVGFDTIDFGSFVSAKAIPQMADTTAVLEGIDVAESKTKLLAIVANECGASTAAAFDKITYIGFPFSISETFQQRNTNSSIAESFARVKEIQQICNRHGKQLVIYISMAFGNPYMDPYSVELVYEWIAKMSDLGIRIISLADTVGVATAAQVAEITRAAINASPEIEIGVHLHSTSENWKEKFEAALTAGCLRFDGALKGIGGCPMANDELVGNMNTEWMMEALIAKGYELNVDKKSFEHSLQLANKIFDDVI